ncbi:hypothetical protein BY996DRAFT_4582284 [Phakopsora pachyrhizi]|nr:hypothetical protein BY996DRAFT_4582284 [Phakopsora pachyrhizi]
MTEYWVSKQSYFCKYCEIFIRDDKPSRAQHENGQRHKNNLERYIRDIYKKSDRTKKQQREESDQYREIERLAIESFERNDRPRLSPSSVIRDGEEVDDNDDLKKQSTSRQAQSEYKKVSAGETDQLRNYSDARSLGLVSEDELKASEDSSKQVRSREEVSIGGWTPVQRFASSKNSQKMPERDSYNDEKKKKKRLFCERVVAEDDGEDLEGEEIKIKVRVDRRMKSEDGSEVFKGTIKPIRLDGIISDELHQDHHLEQQQHQVSGIQAIKVEEDDVKPQIKHQEALDGGKCGEEECTVKFKRRRKGFSKLRA